MIRRSQLHFIHCLVPSLTGESKGGQGAPTPPQPDGDKPGAGGPLPLDIPALRAQLSGSYILEALRLHRAGRSHLGVSALSLMPGTCPLTRGAPGTSAPMMYQELSVDSSQQPCEGEAMSTRILQMSKRKLREMKRRAQGHTAGTWQSLGLDLGLFKPKALFIS